MSVGSPRTKSADGVLCPHLLGVSSQTSHIVEWNCSWNVCGFCIFNEKKETGITCVTCLDAALVLRWTSARKQPSVRVKYRRWFRIQEYRIYFIEFGVGSEFLLRDFLITSVRIVGQSYIQQFSDFVSVIYLSLSLVQNQIRRQTVLYST
jgi:hypothetical protein